MFDTIKEKINYHDWYLEVPSAKDGRLLLHTYNKRMKPLVYMSGFFCLVVLFVLLEGLINRGEIVPFVIFLPIILGVFAFLNVFTQGELDNVNRTFRVSFTFLFYEWVVREFDIPEQAVLKIEKLTERYYRKGKYRTRNVCQFWVVDSEQTFPIARILDKGSKFEIEIRKLSELIATYLQMDIVVVHEGVEVERRDVTLLDESVQQKCQRMLEAGEEVPVFAEPLELLSTIKDDYASLRIEIPPISKDVGIQRVSIILGLLIFCIPMGLLFSIPVEMMLIQALPIIAVACTSIAPCFYRDRIEISEEEIITVKAWKTIKISADDLEGLVVGEPPDKAFRVNTFNQNRSGGVKVISDVHHLQIGTHLPQEEIEYLHHLIIRRLTQHID